MISTMGVGESRPPSLRHSIRPCFSAAPPPSSGAGCAYSPCPSPLADQADQYVPTAVLEPADASSSVRRSRSSFRPTRPAEGCTPPPATWYRDATVDRSATSVSRQLFLHCLGIEADQEGHPSDRSWLDEPPWTGRGCRKYGVRLEPHDLGGRECAIRRSRASFLSSSLLPLPS